MNPAIAPPQDSGRLLSIPAAGRSLSGTVLPLRNSIAAAHRAGVGMLLNSPPLMDRVRGLLGPVADCTGMASGGTPAADLTSAAIISVWLTARANLAACDGAQQAVDWFTGECGGRSKAEALADIDRILGLLASELPDGDDLDDLLPYVLEGFESSELKSVRDRGGAWATKRKDGVFYTPTDVAAHIASTCLSSVETKDSALPNSLDPACGTGVFLRAVLEQLVCRHPDADPSDIVLRLHGMDVSRVALQSAAFVLASRCIKRGSGKPAVALWERISERLARADATTICPPLEEGLASLLGAPTRLRSLFPAAAEGFDVVLGNPPYTRIAPDHNLPLRKALFRTAEGQPTLKAFPLFVEMLLRFAKPHRFAGGMVVPLSIAFSGEKQIQILRRQLESSGASIRFEFFDRTPDSLFGDDVKTRNAIVFVARADDAEPRITTTPLHRWNSRNRPQLFTALPSTQLNGVGISHFIPKLGSELELQAFHALERGRPLAAVFQEHSVVDQRSSLFYYATAYNWLPVFPVWPRFSEADPFPPGSLRELACPSLDVSWFTYGVLISDLAYWLWRVKGDGFHLPRAFIETIRCHPEDLEPGAVEEIRTLAQAAWKRIAQHPTVAVNKGIRTANFDPQHARDVIRAIDEILVEGKRLPSVFARFLSEHRENTVIAGRIHAAS